MIPLPELKNKTEAVYDWLDKVTPGRVFTASEVMKAINRQAAGRSASWTPR